MNEAGLHWFLRSLGGPVMRDMRRRGERVEARARAHADGEILRPKTGLTRDLMRTVDVLADEPYVKVGTIRTKDGFSYPAYWDKNPRLRRAPGRRWLTDALRDRFDS